MHTFDLIKRVFSDKTVEEESELYKETLYMVLTAASRADLNTEAVEVQRIVELLRDLTGEEYSPQDIRFAAETELYDTAPIHKYVGKASKHLLLEHRQQVLYAMIDVFQIDGHMGPLETDYFNTIAEALKLTPAQMIRL